VGVFFRGSAAGEFIIREIVKFQLLFCVNPRVLRAKFPDPFAAAPLEPFAPYCGNSISVFLGL